MASPDEHKLTFLRGSGFLLSLVGAWDLMADASSQWPSQKGFLIFKETKIIAVIERNEDMRTGNRRDVCCGGQSAYYYRALC